MNNWQIALITFEVFSALVTVAMVGRPRKPITPLDVVTVMLLNGLIIFMVIHA